jgi:fructokinase
MVLGIGEVLWDCFPDARRPGGAPANVAFHARQLGHPSLLVSRIGRDQAGDALRQFLQDQSLDVSLLQADATRPTGTVHVDTSNAENPLFSITEDVAWDHLEFEPELATVAARADAICFGTLAQRCERSRATIHQVLEAAPGALRVYDVNLRQAYFDRETIERSLESSRIVKLNEEEASRIAKLLDTTPVGFERMLFDRFGIEWMCVTRGARGCLLVSANERVEADAKPIRLADAVGAGDAFTAALLSARLSDWPLPACASFANDIGGLVASHHGAMPRLREEFEAARARNDPHR